MNCALELAFPKDNSVKTHGRAAYDTDLTFFVGLAQVAA